MAQNKASFIYHEASQPGWTYTNAYLGDVSKEYMVAFYKDEALQLERPEVILQAMANRQWFIAMDISAFYLNFLVDKESSNFLAFRDTLGENLEIYPKYIRSQWKWQLFMPIIGQRARTNSRI